LHSVPGSLELNANDLEWIAMQNEGQAKGPRLS
jgi:hypothetical protein